MTTVTVTFREQTTTVIVDQYHEDHDTNACEVEWHFEGMTPEEHDDLHVSDEEEDAVIEQIQAVMYEVNGDD